MLLSFQKPAVTALCRHFRARETAKFGDRDIHPPIIVSASVSSGKSVMLAECAKALLDAQIERERAAGKAGDPTMRIMVIQRQGILCQQNSEAAWSINLRNSLFSASCGNLKSTRFEVVYATEGTIARALGQYRFSLWTPEELERDAQWRGRAGKFHPDLILIDEGHQVPFEQPDSQYMKTLLHFYDCKPHMRLACMTGSPFRGMASIVGDTPQHLWKKVASIEPGDPDYPEGGVGNGIISTEFMIEQGWVVAPTFGYPEDENTHYDFSHLSTETWDYPEAELDAVVSDKALCLAICADFIKKSADRKGVLVFASTQRHTRQISAAMKLLGVDPEQIGVIIDSTTQKEQTRILTAAKAGKLKYVINVSVLTTGVNVPWWDTEVLMRPIASIVLLIQAIGRILRLLIADNEMPMVERDALTAELRRLLIEASGKPDSLVLDYAGVMDTLGHLYSNPVLEMAELEKAKKEGKDLIECPKCMAMNSPNARRCIGGTIQERCDYFWHSRICPGCGTENDQVARECRSCRRMLIDPNAALNGKHYVEGESIPVRAVKAGAGAGGKFFIRYELADGETPIEVFWPHTGNNIKVNNQIWYKFVDQLPIDLPSKFRLKAMKAKTIEENIHLIPFPVEVSARKKGSKWTVGQRKYAAEELAL